VVVFALVEYVKLLHQINVFCQKKLKKVAKTTINKSAGLGSVQI